MHIIIICLFFAYTSCVEELEWMDCGNSKIPGADWRVSWRALEKEYAEGRVLSIGVSNFGLDDLEELVAFSSIRPHVVQSYMEPGKIDHELVEFCNERNIRLMAYSSLQHRDNFGESTKKALEDIASVHWRSPESIILRSLVQKGVIVIPRSENVVNMLNNQQLFNWDLTNEQLTQLGW